MKEDRLTVPRETVLLGLYIQRDKPEEIESLVFLYMSFPNCQATFPPRSTAAYLATLKAKLLSSGLRNC